MRKNDRIINLFYTKNGVVYTNTIDRDLFLDQMQRFVVWYSQSNNNQNAKELCKIIPDLDTIKVTYSVIQSQDIPFFEYTTYSEPQTRIFKLRRPCTIIWDIILYYCDTAVPVK